MAWSTRELAEITGTTVKTVRHYHEIGLLEEPERSANGYKQYEVSHLVRLLRIRRLTELGLPLNQIPALDQGEDPEQALRRLDEELATNIERLQKMRDELAVILRDRAPADLPEGFAEVAAQMSGPDRAMILLYARLLDPADLKDLRERLREFRPDAADLEFDSLPETTDEKTRQDLAERLVPHIRQWAAIGDGWFSPEGTTTVSAVAGPTISQAVLGLYNESQIDVMRRVFRAIYPQGRPKAGSPSRLPRSTV